ncbi:MAG: nucleotidyl transferase AbiEii/AbiGii toxin family protein [Myxococcota bacterium]
MTTNSAASVRARLANLIATRGGDFQTLLDEYANERLLCRLARSPHADQFVLKGATLFTIWTGKPHRATKDIDLLGYGDASAEHMEAVFREVAAIEIPEDGLVFDPSSVRSESIRKEIHYGGIRILIRGKLANARLNMQVDVGFGDSVLPAPERTTVPCLLAGLPVTAMRAYPREVAIAEKYAAMATLGITNSRMKDFYDVWYLAMTFAFDGDRLAAAIRATFQRRETPLPSEPPVALTQEFAADAGKAVQWQAFARKARVSGSVSLDDVVKVNMEFLWPVGSAHAPVLGAAWPAGGPWSE